MSNNFLAEELKKYYQKIGNKIVFSNKMSLNQLAWEMWERLGYKEIDPSVVSRVLKGERIFTQKQLQIFCRILRLSHDKESQLKEIFWKDCAKKHGVDLAFLRNRDLLDTIQGNLLQIKHLRLNGHPDSVLEWGQIICEEIDSQIKSYKNNKDEKLLSKIKGHIQRERMRALLEVTTKDEIKTQAFPMVKAFKQIAILSKDDYFLGLSEYLSGEIHYRLDERCLALKYYKNAFNILDKNNRVEEALLLLKCSAIIMAKNKDLGEYTKINDLIETKLSYFPDEFCTVMVANRARCENILGINNNGLGTIDLAKRLYSQHCIGENKLASLRKIQLIRTELEICVKCKGCNNSSEVEKLGNEGLDLSIKQGYRPYLDVFPNLLSSILN